MWTTFKVFLKGYDVQMIGWACAHKSFFFFFLWPSNIEVLRSWQPVTSSIRIGSGPKLNCFSYHICYNGLPETLPCNDAIEMLHCAIFAISYQVQSPLH